jgi:hypothetical protein
MAEADGDTVALDNLGTARDADTARHRIEIASQHVPTALKPGSREPLKVLYGPLHSESEAQALQRATDVLDTIVFLFEEMKEHLDRRSDCAAGLHQLSDPKSGN